MSSEMQVTHNQHIIPAFYYGYFVDSTDGKLQILDLRHVSYAKPRQPDSIMYKEFYYGKTTGQYDEVSQEVEVYLRNYETRLARELPSVLAKIETNQRLTPEDIDVLSQHVATLWLRGEYMRRMVQSMAKQFIGPRRPAMKKSMLEQAKQEGFDPSEEEVDAFIDQQVELNNSTHLAMLQEI